jgi:hypothetical protein
METEDERSPILSYKPSTKKISYEMETDDEVDEKQDATQAPEEDEGDEMYPQEEDEGDEMYPQEEDEGDEVYPQEEDEGEEMYPPEEDEPDENADASKEPEQEEVGLSRARAWLKAEMKTHAEAERKRLRDEKYKDRPPTVEEYLQDFEEDKQWEQENNKRSQKLHISALLHQLKIYVTE